MASLFKTPSSYLTPPPLLPPDAISIKPFCISFAGGRMSDDISCLSLSNRPSSSFSSFSSSSIHFGQPLRFLRFVGFATGEAETTETEAEASEPEKQNKDGAVEVEEAKTSVVSSLIQSFREALANKNEMRASLKSIEDERSRLEKKVAILSDELTAERDRTIKISADFENYRKRTERERLSIATNAKGEVVESLLPILDNFERAKTQIKVETEGEDKITNSYQSIYKQFMEILDSLGVVAVESVGERFDPSRQEAVTREESEEMEEGVIMEEYRKGFLLEEKLLRPSMVKVSAGPGPTLHPQQAQETQQEEASSS